MVRLFAKKSLGQNFLIQPQIVTDIIQASGVESGETVVEVGPGTGLLTKELLKTGARVIAIEKDDRLIPVLKETFGSHIEEGVLTLMHGDVLKELPNIEGPYRVIANIPYYITGKLLRLFLEREHKPMSVTVMVQKEVAERIVAKDMKESLLSLSIKVYGDPRYVRTVKAGNFNPAPKVDSAVLHIDNISTKNFTSVSENFFFEVLHKGFSSKRKKVFKNLTSYNKERALDTAFETCSIEKGLRAEDLSVKDWLCLAQHLR